MNPDSDMRQATDAVGAMDGQHVVRDEQRYRRDGSPIGTGPRLTKRGHQHAEAYCLMWYQSRDGVENEYIWNSRDGVTPFTVTARDGHTELVHVHWEMDVYLPDYKPGEGERIFMDITPQWARQSTKEFVDRFWDYLPEPESQIPTMSELYGSKADAIEALMKPLLDPPGQPCVYPS